MNRDVISVALSSVNTFWSVKTNKDVTNVALSSINIQGSLTMNGDIISVACVFEASKISSCPQRFLGCARAAPSSQ